MSAQSPGSKGGDFSGGVGDAPVPSTQRGIFSVRPNAFHVRGGARVVGRAASPLDEDVQGEDSARRWQHAATYLAFYHRDRMMPNGLAVLVNVFSGSSTS